MQFNQLSSTRVHRNKILHTSKDIKHHDVSVSSWKGEQNVCMYNTPPAEDVTLMEFDEIALERLKVLKTIEDVKERHTFGSEEYSKAVEDKLRKMFPIACKYAACNKAEIPHWKRRDIIGHFILRLAFCRSPEQTKWLVNQEVDLFRFRFKNLLPASQKLFLEENNINIEMVSHAERQELAEKLGRGCGLVDSVASSVDFFKIDFTEALDLVRRRKVFLYKGMAYLQSDDLAVIVCGMLRTQMVAAMTRSFKQLGLLEEEGRILPRLARLANNAYSGKQYDGKEQGDKLSRHELNDLCNSSFPPCMKQIHHRLRAEHHLRHGARRQYGLFLKGIGLSLDEAMAFMREEFTKKMDADKFDKQYAYNVRHMYGKEGRRVEGHAFPCSTIILSNPPAAGDCHGCPFKHTDHAVLAQRLAKDNLTKDQVNQVMELSKSSAYDKACTRYFEFSHKMDSGALGQLITHPNQFYELSKEVLSGSRARDNHLVATQSQTPAVPAKKNTAAAPAAAADDDDMDWD